MTRADKSWNIFPTAQRFPFFTNSVDSHINMRTICGTVNPDQYRMMLKIYFFHFVFEIVRYFAKNEEFGVQACLMRPGTPACPSLPRTIY